jgi:hypothetical protein
MNFIFQVQQLFAHNLFVQPYSIRNLLFAVQAIIFVILFFAAFIAAHRFVPSVCPPFGCLSVHILPSASQNRFSVKLVSF